MNTTKPTSIRLEPDVVEALDRLAEIENTMRSRLMARVISDYAANAGKATLEARIERLEQRLDAA